MHLTCERSNIVSLNDCQLECWATETKHIGSRIGSKVLGEVGEAIRHDDTFNRSACEGEFIVTETYPMLALVDSISKTIHELIHSGEQNCEYAEAHQLNWFHPQESMKRNET